MHIEIDQSGKIESNKDTVIAFSNDETIKIRKTLKRELFQKYRKTEKFIFVLKIFSIVVFLTIKEHLKGKESIIIDDEYPGHGRFIKSKLLKLIRKKYPEFDEKIIRIGRIGKKSEAHKLAYSTFLGKRKPNKIISIEEILELL